MSKYFELLLDGEFQYSFTGSKEQEARDLFKKVAENNPNKLVKLVMHRRKDLLTNKTKTG